MAAKLRCAIYTRKSSEEGLEQDFNSLHAQRESCEAYVLSQAGEGWSAISTHYDDGGFSGGSMERPGLAALLADIAAGKVDIVVVYKVDRLTRSLADFAKIVEQFDARGVSFVSVTQAFNTTSSMGRLTLNVLLSFAQFEREVTGERIRDKIAASKAKGMWMGGVPPLGYDFKDRRLVVNEAEAAVVRRIFEGYLRFESIFDLVEDLKLAGIRSKSWTTAAGRSMGGQTLKRGALYHILQARVYLGDIVHKDRVHGGLHDPVIDQGLFAAVAKKLEAKSVERRNRIQTAGAAALAGKMFDESGRLFTPTFSYGRNGRLYRYYVTAALQRGEIRAAQSPPISRLPAGAAEAFVQSVASRLVGREIALEDAADLVIRVEVRRQETHIILNGMKAFQTGHPELILRATQKSLLEREIAVIEPGDKGELRIVLPHALRLRGGQTWLQGATRSGGSVNAALVAALRKAHRDLAVIGASPLSAAGTTATSAPATQHGRLMAGLAFLSPELQRRLFEGRLPAGLTVKRFLSNAPPLAWADQEDWAAKFG